MADEKFLAFAQEGKIELFLDSLYARKIVDVKLTGRNLAHLVGGLLIRDSRAAHPLGNRRNIRSQKLIQVALERRLFQLHVPHDGVVGGSGLFVLIEFKDEFVESCDSTADILVRDIDGRREKLVFGIGDSELLQVLSMGDFSLQAFHLLSGLDALGHVRLTVILNAEKLIVLLERCNLRLLRTELRIQLGYAGVDIFGCLLDDVLFLLYGILVINSYNLVEDIGGSLRRSVPEGQIDDTVRSAVP